MAGVGRSSTKWLRERGGFGTATASTQPPSQRPTRSASPSRQRLGKLPIFAPAPATASRCTSHHEGSRNFAMRQLPATLIVIAGMLALPAAATAAEEDTLPRVLEVSTTSRFEPHSPSELGQTATAYHDDSQLAREHHGTHARHDCAQRRTARQRGLCRTRQRTGSGPDGNARSGRVLDVQAAGDRVQLHGDRHDGIRRRTIAHKDRELHRCDPTAV